MNTQDVGASCPLRNRPMSRTERDRRTLLDAGYSPETIATIMGDTGQLSVMLRFRDGFTSPKYNWLGRDMRHAGTRRSSAP